MMGATTFARQAATACGGRAPLLRSPGRTVRTASSLLPSHGGAFTSGTSGRPASSSRRIHAWSSELSYASPESDFTSQQVRLSSGTPPAAAAAEWSHSMSFTSPESDFTAAPSPSASLSSVRDSDASGDSLPLWSGMLSFASPESDFVSQGVLPRAQPSDVGLPRTLREVLALEDAVAAASAQALGPSEPRRVPAMVVTTADAPHRIVHVNRAWEELCGYDRDEVVHEGKTLSILQGPKSNADLARSAVSQLVRTHRAVDMYQVNYTKSGREFVNHVTMGPMTLSEDSPDVEFLVAVLEKVEPDRVPLRLVSY